MEYGIHIKEFLMSTLFYAKLIADAVRVENVRFSLETDVLTFRITELFGQVYEELQFNNFHVAPQVRVSTLGKVIGPVRLIRELEFSLLKRVLYRKLGLQLNL